MPIKPSRQETQLQLTTQSQKQDPLGRFLRLCMDNGCDEDSNMWDKTAGYSRIRLVGVYSKGFPSFGVAAMGGPFGMCDTMIQ